MLILFVLFCLSSDLQQIGNECQIKYDLSLFKSSHDKSLYLEARNEILYADYLMVECNSSISRNFTVNKHLSFFNSHTIFRAYIGNSEYTTVGCNITINYDTCEVTNDNYTFSLKNYNPQKNTELDPKLSVLKPYDTRNGFYT